MRLLVQPDDGVGPLVKAIKGAKRNIEIVIFRFKQSEIERNLASAVSRGVAVHALIAHYTNRAGEEGLRRLEMRLLAAEVTVARSADEFARYHGKLRTSPQPASPNGRLPMLSHTGDVRSVGGDDPDLQSDALHWSHQCRSRCSGVTQPLW